MRGRDVWLGPALRQTPPLLCLDFLCSSASWGEGILYFLQGRRANHVIGLPRLAEWAVNFLEGA
ncbi:hypothetical protein CSUI_006371 [Cystoisospora suis]|uniref:Uncharacterized protein n=1 Tax=Cystoisospora suis TaxID=483139 RepID=A0A2C6KQJ4_9APIC|nr:hypothetical protein CSUI_006371 [Cystoisospora suis]